MTVISMLFSSFFLLIVNMKVNDIISLFPVIEIPIMAHAIIYLFVFTSFIFLTVAVRNEITLIIFMEKRFF